MAGFGPASGGKTVIWVDYADAISLHPVVTTNPKEHRLTRIKSSTPEDHRISFGCINVPARFYEAVVLKAFAGGSAIVYILPDTRPLEDVFPAFAATMQASAVADYADQAAARPAQFDAVQAGDAQPAAAIQPSADPDQLGRDPTRAGGRRPGRRRSARCACGGEETPAAHPPSPSRRASRAVERRSRTTLPSLR